MRSIFCDGKDKERKRFVVLYLSKLFWIVARGYRLYKYYPDTDKLIFFSRLVDSDNGQKAAFSLTRRLFRAEITHLYHFQNDNWMCIGKKALFKYNRKNELFEKCCDIEKGSRPMNLCQGNDGTIYYGEYCFNPDKRPMRIFLSKDDGKTWSVAYTFGKGEINHIHGIFNDPYTKRLWVATGDDDDACIFGYTEDGFKTFIREFEGTQQNRICVPLFLKDEIIFATDTQYEQNYIRSINRKTGKVHNLQTIQGSGIYAVQFGSKMLVSTTVEPSAVNKDRWSNLWYSEDGHRWREIAKHKKDYWHTRYFQFGSIRFPHYSEDYESIVYTGRALKGIDGKTVIMTTDTL